MSRFRKKPVVIDAFRWTGDHDQEDDPVWIVEALKDGRAEISKPAVLAEGVTLHMRLHTLEGTMTAAPGDWIIRGTKGELYPCKPDIFADIYEPVAA